MGKTIKPYLTAIGLEYTFEETPLTHEMFKPRKISRRERRKQERKKLKKNGIT